MSDGSSDRAPELPSEGRLAGIDFGTVRIGIATCDPTQSWVTPHGRYTRRNESLDARYFRDLAEGDQIAGWVIGLPIHCDGRESQKSREARSFGEWLGEATGRPFVFFDERFTTAEARQLLQSSTLSPGKRKERLDELAAHLILSHFLTSQQHRVSQNEALDDG